MERNFAVAILASVLLHAVIGFVFVVKICPVAGKKIEFSKINFLGPLLIEMKCSNKIAYLRANDMNHASSNSILTRNMVEYEVSGNKAKVEFARMQPVESYQVPRIEDINIHIKEIPELERESLFFMDEEKRQIYRPAGVEITGPVSAREVIYQPKLPKIMRWNLQLGEDRDMDRFLVKIKFKISKDGSVEKVEKISSCGYPKIDLLGINYIKMWKFAPIDENDKNQWGSLKLYINKS